MIDALLFMGGFLLLLAASGLIALAWAFFVAYVNDEFPQKSRKD